MTKEDLNILRESFINSMKSMMIGEGDIMPMMVIHIMTKDNQKGNMLLPLKKSFMDKNDPFFISKIVPKLKESIDGEGYKVYGISVAGEVWTRDAPADFVFTQAAYEALEKREALFISSYHIYGTDVELLDITRDGQSVNEDGQLIDTIFLNPRLDMSEAELVHTNANFEEVYQLLKS